MIPYINHTWEQGDKIIIADLEIAKQSLNQFNSNTGYNIRYEK
jgi:hypothetical protein